MIFGFDGICFFFSSSSLISTSLLALLNIINMYLVLLRVPTAARGHARMLSYHILKFRSYEDSQLEDEAEMKQSLTSP